jgi:hypothetical protein
LDGVIGNEIRDVTHKAYPDVQEKRAVEHLKDGVKYYGDAMLHLANAAGEGIFKPLAVNLDNRQKRKRSLRKLGRNSRNGPKASLQDKTSEEWQGPR